MSTFLGSYVIPVTHATVSDIPIELNLVVRYFEYKETYLIKLHIALPDNYPETILSANYIINQVGLFEADITVMDPKSNWIPSFNKIQKLLSRPAEYGLILNSFYIIPKRDQIPLTHDEKHFLKGLGKKALCAGINHIITLLIIDPSKTVILLEATRWNILSESDEMTIQHYISWSYEDLLNFYKKRYYEDYLLYEPDNNDDDEKEILAETLVTTNNNKKLIDYYKTAFGFISLNRLINGKHMGAFLDTFLDHC